jgi:DNA modification methylase
MAVNLERLKYTLTGIKDRIIVSIMSENIAKLDSDEIQDKLFLGDSTTELERFPTASINLIVTSPPYADNRKKTYKGFPIKKYVELFLPISLQLQRVLKPDGSFVLNIKERSVDGERQTYVLELILAMKKQGWLWTEEYMWCKSNCYPGKWPNRFRDSWERCLHFTLQKQFKMRQESVMVPVGDWAIDRLKKLSPTDKMRDESKVGSGFGKNISNWLDRELVYPTNVLHLATECSNRNHSATFPLGLPSWFIKLFSDEEDLVLDPFMGVGTTAIAAIKLNRHYVGIELSPNYHELSKVAVSLEKAALEKKGNGNGHRRIRNQNLGKLEGVPQAPVTSCSEAESSDSTET